MSAWAEVEGSEIKESERKFEDNFVSKEFKKLDDSEEYLKILENRLKKIKKNSGVLNQLKEKREDLINNLLNESQTINTDKDFQLETEIETNKLISQINPKQPQTVGEIAHLIKHDHLNQQKEEQEEEENKETQ
ncbi:hypothetical protein PVAND_005982 [Polypedilum vanderplanki]|uniref:Uncharacterized protein n=1 Tax=Polypedilum vanderplanki TaxID=319348 RepID=A0A9J6C2U4_POLVA|nr:hypothetical protein PVAND_005982 [Polypedilum vanderplanki]